jgi:hypothetical protein
MRHHSRPRSDRQLVTIIGSAVIAVVCLATLAAAIPAQPVAGQVAPSMSRRVAAAPLVERRGEAPPAQATSPMPPAAEAQDPGTLVWDPGADFRPSPGQVNPNPDSYGRDGVWSYLASADFDHDPDRYTLLPHYSIIDAGRQQWDSPEFVNLLVAHLSGERRLLLHAYGGNGSGVRSAILGWRSPISGHVTVQGTVEVTDTNCAAIEGGIVFWIDYGPHTLERFVIPAGSRQDLSLDTTVEANEFLYFITDPGLDSNCDTTLLTLSIQADASDLPDTAMRTLRSTGERSANEGRR